MDDAQNANGAAVWQGIPDRGNFYGGPLDATDTDVPTHRVFPEAEAAALVAVAEAASVMSITGSFGVSSDSHGRAERDLYRALNVLAEARAAK